MIEKRRQTPFKSCCQLNLSFLQNKAPNKNQSAQLACQSPATYDTVTKECYCANGERMTERDTDGQLLNRISCEKCQLGEYSGRFTPDPWSCQACPDPRMTYNYDKTLCECPQDLYRQAGDACVLNTDFAAMSTYLRNDNALKMTYYDLLD